MIFDIQNISSIAGVVTDDLVDTSISMTDEKIIGIDCIGCSVFADSVLLQSTSTVSASARRNGWCMHTVVAEEVLDVLEEHGSSPFAKYIESEIRNEEKVTLFGSHGNLEKYLVFADDIESFQAKVPIYSVCTVRNCLRKRYVHCRDIRCRKSKHQALHNIIDVANICCHLRKLLLVLSHKGDEIAEEPIQGKQIIEKASNNQSSFPHLTSRLWWTQWSYHHHDNWTRGYGFVSQQPHWRSSFSSGQECLGSILSTTRNDVDRYTRKFACWSCSLGF